MAVMLIPAPWYVLAGVATLINSAVLGVMARREGSQALRYWSWAWLTWAAAVVPLMLLDRDEPGALPAAVCGLLWVASTLCFLRGSYALFAGAMPRAWYAVAAACGCVAFALGIAPTGQLGMLPLALFQSVGLAATGVLMIRGARDRAGAWVSGGALISMALHLLATPAFAHDPELMAWGFVAATSFEILTALGMIMLYYEQASAQLLDAQRALEEARRIEALGRIAGGVAHDFNNMLTVMQCNLDLIRVSGDRPLETEEALSSIEQAIRQAARLTAQLLAFGRRSVVQPRAIGIRDVVRDTLELLRQVIPENVELEFRGGSDACLGSMDRSLLEQIVLNLVTNARDALAGPGRILVELERLELPEPRLLLRVIDNGAGMDESVVKQIFEPFFTTKAVGRGAGLGLASVQGAVSQLGGKIRVESELGHGSTFEVVLPLVAAEGSAAPASAPAQVGPLDILVVDDSDGVRQVCARMLELGGHHVQQARNGAEALELLRAARYDVVLSDVVMPGIGGLALQEAVFQRWPQTLVVLTSGYPRDAELRASKVHFLPKPFQQSTLLDSIARLVAERRSVPEDSAVESAAARRTG